LLVLFCLLWLLFVRTLLLLFKLPCAVECFAHRGTRGCSDSGRYSDSHACRIKREGQAGEAATVALPAAAAATAHAVTFRHMDPGCLAPDIGAYDAVVVSDELIKVASPRALLGRMGGVAAIVKPGGAPITWLDLSSVQLFLCT
jgi:hypothetical protein